VEENGEREVGIVEVVEVGKVGSGEGRPEAYLPALYADDEEEDAGSCWSCRCA
jgi:hypothetical protein